MKNGIKLCGVVGLMYLVGGMNDLGTEMLNVESYNPITKEWCRLASLRFYRAYVGIAILDNYLYAVGGWNEDSGALDTVEKYSIEEVSVLLNLYFHLNS